MLWYVAFYFFPVLRTSFGRLVLIFGAGNVKRIETLIRALGQGLSFFETSRGDQQSPEWLSRQLRKVYGAIKAIDQFSKSAASDGRAFLVGNELTIADIAAGAMLGMFDMVETKFQLIKWKEEYPDLVRYWQGLEERESFKATKPVMFDLTEKVA